MTAEEYIAMQREKLAKFQDRTCNPEKKRKCEHPESELQKSCVRWFRLQYPFPRYLIFAIPNGGYRNRLEAKIMVGEGMQAGCPDLQIPVPNAHYHGLFIEMKNGKKGVVSEHQKEIMAYLTKQGYKCAVCRDFDSFKATVDEYMKDKP